MNESVPTNGSAQIIIDTKRCFGCGTCFVFCLTGVYEMVDNKPHVIDADLCMECGACVRECPAKAITIKPGSPCDPIPQWKTGLEKEFT